MSTESRQGSGVPSVYDLPYGHPLRRDEADDMEALREQLRQATEAHLTFLEGLTEALNAHGVPAMASWREAIDWLAANGGRS